jgi:hypothetical protein
LENAMQTERTSPEQSHVENAGHGVMITATRARDGVGVPGMTGVVVISTVLAAIILGGLGLLFARHAPGTQHAIQAAAHASAPQRPDRTP